MDGESKVGHKSKRSTKDRTLYTHRTVPCNLPGMLEPKQCCGRRHFPYSVVGTINSHTILPDKHGKAPHTCLWASTVLWAPAFTIPGEHGKTPYIPLGINSMAGTDVYHTRRRRRNLPHASDINSVMGAYNHLVPDDMGNKT